MKVSGALITLTESADNDLPDGNNSSETGVLAFQNSLSFETPIHIPLILRVSAPDGDNVDLDGGISGDNFAVGGGIVTLTAVNNTYTGFTYLHNGTLSIANPNYLPNAVQPIVFNAGIVTDTVSTLALTAPLTFQNPILIGNGFDAVIDTGGNPISLYSNISDLTSGGNIEFAGGNVITFYGDATNSGESIIDAGTTLQAGAVGVFSPSSVFYQVDGVLNLNSFNQTIQGISGAGDITLGTATLTLNGSSGATTFGGVISGSGNLDLKEGTLTLTNINTYQCTTRVGANGTLIAGIDHPISSTSHLEVVGALDLNDGSNDYNVTVNGLSGTGSIDLGKTGQKSLTILGNGTNAFSGSLSGIGHVIVGEMGTFAPTLQLTGPNTYQGDTIIYGTVQAGSTAALSSASSIFLQTNGATLDLNGFNSEIAALSGSGSVLTEGASLTVGAGSYSGDISGEGVLIKKSLSGFVLSGANTLAEVIVEEGNLQIYTQENIGSAHLVFHPGSTGSTEGLITFLDTNQVFTNNVSVADGFKALFIGNEITLQGDISDETSNGIVQFSGGEFLLTGDNTNSGTTVVNMGTTLNAGSTTALSSNSLFEVLGTLTLSDGTTDYSNSIGSLQGNGTVVLGETGNPTFPLLTIANGNGHIYTGSFTHSGSIELQTGELFLGGTGSTFSGSTMVDGPAILISAVSGSLSPNSAITVAGTLEIGETVNTIPSISGGGLVSLGTSGTGSLTFTAPTSFDGNISGSGSLTFSSGGMDVLTGDNTYSGPTTISIGDTLSAGSTTAFSSSSDFLVDGTLSLVSYNNTIKSLAGSGTVDLGITSTVLTIANGSNLRFSGHLTDNGGIELQAGTLTFAPTLASDYYGPTTIDPGSTLEAGATNPFSQNSPFLVNGILSLNDGTNDYSATVASIGGTNSSATINLGSMGGAILTINGATSSYFPGSITGKGGLGVGSSSSFILNGTTHYSGPTTVEGQLIGTESGSFSPHSDFTVDGELFLSDHNNTLLSLSGSGMVDLGMVSTTVLTVQGGDFTGNIFGAGQLNIDASGTFTLEADNSYSGGTTITNGTLALKNGGAILSTGNLSFLTGGTFDIQQITAASQTIADLSGGDLSSSIHLGDKNLFLGTSHSTTYGGTFEGLGEWIKQGSGTLTLTGSATNSGGMEILSGTVIGNTANIQSSVNVELGANLTFSQATTGTFAGSLKGLGKVFKIGNGTLNYNSHSDVSGFTGTTTVSQGTLSLNTALGGHVVVQNLGTLSGTGTVKGSLYINNGGTMAPGHSIGRLTVLGDYVQNSNTTYLVQVDGAGDSSLVNVEGTANLFGGEVVVSSIDGKVLIHQLYDILHADGGVFNTFAGVNVPTFRGNPLLFAPQLIYGPNDVFLEFATTFIKAAQNSNQGQVALQLDSIVNLDPEQALFLSDLASLPTAEVASLLQQLTGQQQSADLFAVQLVNRQFLRRLYDPIRAIVTTLPCLQDPSPCGWTAWIEGGWDRSSIDDNSEASGFKMYGGEITAGIQKELDEFLTVGFASSYVFDKLDYREGGKAWMNHALVGFYALFRPDNFYLLADALYGYSHHRISRQVSIPGLELDITSSPVLNQITVYSEAGIDLPCGRLLFQPFVAFEVGGVWRNSVSESGGGDFDLHVEEREEANAYSRLGLHATTNDWPYGLRVSLDAAWQCRLTDNKNCIWESFSTFGSSFNIQGITVDRNSFQGAVTISYPLDKSVVLFAEGGGEAWRNASTYAFTFGITASW